MVHLKNCPGKSLSSREVTKKNAKGKFSVSGLERQQVRVTALVLNREGSEENDVNRLAGIIFMETLKPPWTVHCNQLLNVIQGRAVYANTIQIRFSLQRSVISYAIYRVTVNKDQFLQLHPATYFFIVNKPDEGEKGKGRKCHVSSHLSWYFSDKLNLINCIWRWLAWHKVLAFSCKWVALDKVRNPPLIVKSSKMHF